MSESMTALKAQLEGWRNRARAVKVEAEGVADRGFSAGTSLAAGALTGYARGKWGEGTDKHIHIPGTEIEADLAGAVVLLAAGVTGLAGKKSDLVTSAGAGVGAYLLGRMMEEKGAGHIPATRKR